MDFNPFCDKDFDAYLQNKWQSRVFNRERLDVRQKLEALGRRLAPGLSAADGAPLESDVSAEHPALWNQQKVQYQQLFFSRPLEARKEIEGMQSRGRTMAALIEDPSPLRNHIFLGLSIDKDQVEIALKLHADAAVDRENLQRKCQEYFQREKLLNLLNELPAPFTVGIQGSSEQASTSVDDDGLKDLVQSLTGCASWLRVGRAFARTEPVVQQEEFVEVAREHLAHLLPLYHFIAWSRDNDFLAIKETLRKQEVKTKARGLARNDRVRVTRGVFSGKTGVVQEVAAKGGIKVLIGTMLVKLSSEDVVRG